MLKQLFNLGVIRIVIPPQCILLLHTADVSMHGDALSLRRVCVDRDVLVLAVPCSFPYIASVPAASLGTNDKTTCQLSYSMTISFSSFRLAVYVSLYVRV